MLLQHPTIDQLSVDFTSLFAQFNLLNMLSSVAANSLGETVPLSYSSLDPYFLTFCVDA